eukprot:9507227-Alexandrium_andersonii.AAC.1
MSASLVGSEMCIRDSKKQRPSLRKRLEMKGVAWGPRDPATGLRPLAADLASVPAEEGPEAAAEPAA